MVQGKTVTVEVIEEHTYDGVLRTVGSQYEAEEAHLEFLGLQHFARPVPPPPDDAAQKPPRRK